MKLKQFNFSVWKTLEWRDLDQGIDPQDKLAIFEEYHTRGNLYESTSQENQKYFASLLSMGDAPKKGTKYIVVPLSLISNRIVPLDKPTRMTYLRKSLGQMIFTYGSETVRYPSLAMRDLSIFNTFTFLNQDTYDRFRTALALKFNSHLPLPL